MHNATKKRLTNRKIQIAIALALILLLAAGCGRNRDEAADTQDTQSEAVTANEDSNEDNNTDDAQAAGDPAQGEQLYQGTCSACHGPEAEGVQGLGKSLHPSESEFVESRTDEEVVDFIKAGRQPDHPDNDTGVAMPPKGGNPALSDEDLYDIVAWMRTLD